MINTQAKQVLLAIVMATALFLSGCGDSVGVPIPQWGLPTEVSSLLNRALAAYRDLDFDTLALVRRNPDGTPLDVEEAKYHMGRIRDFLAYEAWEVISVETRDFRSYWVGVRLTYPDGRTHDSSVSLRWFEDGWKVTGMYPKIVPTQTSP